MANVSNGKPYLVNCDGEMVSVNEYCKRKGLNYGAITNKRYKTGLSYEELLPKYERGEIKPKLTLVKLNGEDVSLSVWCRAMNVSEGTLFYRMKKHNISLEEAMQYYEKYGAYHAPNKGKVKIKRLNKLWANIKARCYSPKNPRYANYGGRGIKICDRWLDYANFEADLGKSYLEHVEKFGEIDTTLDRYDNDKDYEPSNCHWATRKEQARNRKSAIKLETGELLIDYCERMGLNYNYVKRKMKEGYSLEEIKQGIDTTYEGLCNNCIDKVIHGHLILEKINYSYCICECLVCDKKQKKNIYDLVAQNTCCSCRTGQKIYIGENNYTYKEYNYIKANMQIDLENISQENWLKLIKDVHKRLEE